MQYERWILSRRTFVVALVAAVCLQGCLGVPERREVIARSGENPDPARKPAAPSGGLIGSLLRLAASLVPRVYVSVPILESREES